MRKFNSRKITVALLVLFAGFCFWQALPRTVSHDAAQILSPTVTADITLTSASSSAIRTQAIESIKVGQRVLAKNPEISNFDRRTRRAEPDFSRWLQLSVEMPKPDGSTLTIQMLRSEEWLRNQIGFVITDNPDDELTITNEASQRNTAFDFSFPLASSSSLLAPLSPLRPIFSDILFTSLAAEAEGAELVGLTVQLDLPELGLTGEAILAGIQTTPEIEAPIDHRDERQVVTATFHHSSGDVIDLVVADSSSSLPGRTFAEGEPYALDAADSSTVDNSGNADESQVAASREVLLGKEDLQANRTAPGSDQEQLNAENRTLKTLDEAETIGTTSNHPFWSVDRGEYVQAGSLKIGERLQTLSGDVKVVQQKLPRPGPQPVFNLEVHDEHVYFVGEDGVLVHNAGPYGSGRARVGHSRLTEGDVDQVAFANVRSRSKDGLDGHELWQNANTQDTFISGGGRTGQYGKRNPAIYLSETNHKMVNGIQNRLIPNASLQTPLENISSNISVLRQAQRGGVPITDRQIKDLAKRSVRFYQRSLDAGLLK